MDAAQEFYEEHRALMKPINETIAKGNSTIQKFYEGTCIFVTGGTGFLGKQLIEKLLRSCNIKRIYVLIRSKKGVHVNERLTNYLKEPVYDELKKYQPDFADKILPIEGDVADLRLGISDIDWITLTQEVNIIFHAAATTRFEEHLRTSTLINVRGTREVLTLAKACKSLKSFVYVSTAYSHGTENRIGKEVLEKFYPCPVPPETIIQLAEHVDKNKLNAITPEFIHDWPNTYTFTKAIAEEIVRIMGEGLPVCIVRPPIVTPSYFEPVPGWIDPSNIYGPSGILLGVGLGAVHVLLTNKDALFDIVPVDYVNNTLIASAWDTANSDRKDITIYTIHNETGFTWGIGGRLLRSPEVRRFSTPKSLWYCCAVETMNKHLFWILTWLFHYIPGYIADLVCFAFSIKISKEVPSLIKIYEKLHKMSLIYSYYLLNEWDFKNDNTKDLYNRLSQDDKAIFNFDTSTVDWTRLIRIWCLGLRIFVVKDGLKGTAYAVRKQNAFKILTYMFIFIYIIVVCFILSAIAGFIF